MIDKKLKRMWIRIIVTTEGNHDKKEKDSDLDRIHLAGRRTAVLRRLAVLLLRCLSTPHAGRILWV